MIERRRRRDGKVAVSVASRVHMRKYYTLSISFCLHPVAIWFQCRIYLNGEVFVHACTSVQLVAVVHKFKTLFFLVFYCVIIFSLFIRMQY